MMIENTNTTTQRGQPPGAVVCAIAACAILAAALGVCVQSERPAESVPTSIGSTGLEGMPPSVSSEIEPRNVDSFFYDPPPISVFPSSSIYRSGCWFGPTSLVTFDGDLDKLQPNTNNN